MNLKKISLIAFSSFIFSFPFPFASAMRDAPIDAFVYTDYSYRPGGKLSSLTNYTECPEFSKIQRSYIIIEALGFFTNPEYTDFLNSMSQSIPKNLSQKSIFPYWTDKYSAE